MMTRKQVDRFLDNPVVEWTIFAIGMLLLAASPLVGVIPGPGGIIVAGIGLAMVLKTSLWAKRRYARFKRWNFKLFGRYVAPGKWTDLALRRRSALRRERIRKERERLERERQAIAGD